MQGKVEIAGVNTAKLKVLKSSETMELLRRSKAGDTKEFVDDNGGTYVFFFQDFAETYRDLLVTNKLKTEWYDEVTSAATYTYDADAAKHANLGLTIANIYGSSSSSN